MCLTKLTHGKTNLRVGYKVFRYSKANEGQLAPTDKILPRGVHFRFNTWIKDTNNYNIWTANDGKNNQYQTGFHIFLDEADAEWIALQHPSTFIYRKVNFRKVVARGIQEIHFRCERRCRVIIAKELYIHEKEEVNAE